jgi:riboflavin transporter FmnP
MCIEFLFIWILHEKVPSGVTRMLYLITLTVIFVWMVTLLRKKQLSWHALIATYSIAVFSTDSLEVTFNLLLNLYKFPTHLVKDPVFANELGIIFANTIILPFTNNI